LRREGKSPVDAHHAGDRPVLVAYCDCDPAEFVDVLVRCHEESQDCPELHGIRTPVEVVAGYRDCAPDTGRWWLARRENSAVGVLVLGADELVFVGVVPEHRGRGIGRGLVEAACAAVPVLSVTVDERNAPAMQLYYSVGFRAIGVRDVYFGSPDHSAGAMERKLIR
jgi:ribosomal protein S18 acetylase RimI-like enzyme